MLRATTDLGTAPAWTLTGRGLEATVRPLWAGVRPYADEQDPTKVVREFRDPGQFTPEYLRLWERLPNAPGHPVAADGRLVFLDVHAPAEGAPHPADPEHAVLYPHAAYQCGTTGDSIVMVDGEHGEKIPELKNTVTDKATIERILNPGGGYKRDQVSPGFLRFTVDGPGVWVAPDGTRHEYDREQIVNPADPRVPEHLRPWVGPNYLGVGFDGRTGWTRGRGVARIGLDGITPDAPDPTGMSPETYDAPRLFTLTRASDESGVSGTGLVLRGIVWPAGQVTVCWCAPAGPVPIADNIPQSYKSWQHFAAIHIGQHPPEQSEIEFMDGQPPPALTAAPQQDPDEAPVTMPTPPAVPPVPPVATPDAPPPAPPAPAADPAALMAENKMLKARVAELEQALAAASTAKTAADGQVTTLKAQVDGLTDEIKPHREAQRAATVAAAASVANVDPADLGKLDGDPRVNAMRLRLTADGTLRDKASDDYLLARFDQLAEQNPSRVVTSMDGPSPAFRESVNPKPHGAKVKPDTSFSELE